MMKRRDVLRALGIAAVGAGVGAGLEVRAQGGAGKDRRYLFVVGAMGGASILDSFLPVLESESPNGQTLTTFAPSLVAQPPGSNLRCVAPLTAELGATYRADYEQATFLSKYKDDIAVMTLESASVNHTIAQARAMTGGAIDRGRTLLEAAGDTHGAGLPLPVCNMTTGGYAEAGRDPALAPHARQVTIGDPRYFAFGTHGHRGLGTGLDEPLIVRGREARAALDATGPFARRHAKSLSRQKYLELRERGGAVEEAGLIDRLMLLDDAELESYGLAPTPLLGLIRDALPKVDTDPLHAQAALAFLLVQSGVSCAVAIAPTNGVRSEMQKVTNTQLAFDYSHTIHRVAQHVMWSRVLSVVDGLITLLKSQEAPESPGQSLWDKSLVYLATDFGREKIRPSGALAFGTGHHTNNGVVMISPLLAGNRVYGGVDPSTCLTFGFDPQSGEPAPGTVMTEGDVYSAICQALGVGFPGRRDVPAMMA
jgi:hypothetical protein